MKRKRYLDPIAQKVYDYIIAHFEDAGFAPSQREIAEACGIAKGTVTNALWRLEARRLIDITPGKARGIRLHEPDR